MKIRLNEEGVSKEEREQVGIIKVLPIVTTSSSLSLLSH